MPPRYDRPIIGEINFYQDEPSPSPESSFSPGGKVTINNQGSDSNIPMSDEPIDPALLGALQNPKERMQALSIEQSLLTFVHSK